MAPASDFTIVFAAMYSKKEDKKREENVDHLIEKDVKEQSRRRQPRTKPAKP